MKRLIVLALLFGLLLCACGQINQPTEPATGDNSETPAATTTEPPAAEQTTTQPPKAEAEKVTVYLLKETVYYDSGSVQYHYDENHNINSYTVFTLEGTTMYEVFFSEKDANGMAGKVQMQWSDDAGNETREMTYSADGKLQQEQIVGMDYTGYQYAYDQAGNRTEKREYYEGILLTIVYYEYEGGQLSAVYCEDKEGTRVYDCKIENGLITERIGYDFGDPYSYLYEYDANNNPISSTFCFGGETMPGDQYIYEAVEVDADRAPYLLEQQKYLIPIT